MWNRHLNKGVHVYINMWMWGRLRSNVRMAEATVTIQVFFRPLNFKQVCDDGGFPAETYWYLIQGDIHLPKKVITCLTRRKRELQMSL